MRISNSQKVLNMRPDNDPLQLSRLPLLEPSEETWPAIRQELELRARRQSRLKSWAGSLGIAAGFALALALVLQAPGEPTAGIPPETQRQASDSSSPVDVDVEQQLARLIGLSQRLETQLRVARNDLPGMPVGSLVHQVELEDLIAQIDDRLVVEPDSVPLWQRRISLLLDLSSLYKNEMRRERLQMASL